MSQYKQSYQLTSQQSTNSLTKFEMASVRLTPSARIVFEYMFPYFKRYEIVDVSQERIRDDTGLSLSSVERAIAKLKEYKFIRIQKPRGWNPRNKYYLHDFFKSAKNRLSLSYIFKSFKSYYKKFLDSRFITLCKSSSEGLINSLNYNIYLNNPVMPRMPRSVIKVTYSKQESECKNGERGIINSYRKEKKMKKEEIVLVTPAIHDATSDLNLTTHGKCKLRAFEDLAITRALGTLDKARGIRNDFDFVVSEAIKFSQQNRLPINWKRYYFLRDSYQIPAEDRNFAEQKTLKVEKVGYIPKRKTSEYERPKDPEVDHYGEISNHMAEQRKIEFEAREEKRRVYWEQKGKEFDKSVGGLSEEEIRSRAKIVLDEGLEFEKKLCEVKLLSEMTFDELENYIKKGPPLEFTEEEKEDWINKAYEQMFYLVNNKALDEE